MGDSHRDMRSGHPGLGDLRIDGLDQMTGFQYPRVRPSEEGLYMVSCLSPAYPYSEEYGEVRLERDRAGVFIARWDGERFMEVSRREREMNRVYAWHSDFDLRWKERHGQTAESSSRDSVSPVGVRATAAGVAIAG